MELLKEEVTACPVCLCDDSELYHEGIQDTVFSCPGTWNLRKCSGCGSLFLSPRVALAHIGRIYEGYPEHQREKQAGFINAPRGMYKNLRRSMKDGVLAHVLGYDRSCGRLFSYLGKVWKSLSPFGLDRVLASVLFLPAKYGGRVLDVGCGGGGLLFELQRYGWIAQGVDMDAATVAICREAGLAVSCGTLYDQGYPDDHFDAITLRHVLEHDLEPHKLFAECRRVLKPGGFLSVITPNADSLGHRTFGRDWRGLEPPRHIQIFSRESLRLLALRAGLEVDTLRASTRTARFMWKASMAIKGTSPRLMPVFLAERLFGLREALAGPSAGEELILVVRKR
jgi:SAM-dependent methyltransferase